jgi:hypothetical protein
MSAKSNFKAAVKKAKTLYKTGKYKKFSDAVKAAYRSISGISKTRQTGSTTTKADKKRKAKAPGKRKSAAGKVYYERRKNRSDRPHSLSGVKAKMGNVKVKSKKPGSGWRLYDGARNIEQAADMVSSIRSAGFQSVVWQLKPGNDGYAIGFRYYVYVPKNSWM